MNENAEQAKGSEARCGSTDPDHGLKRTEAEIENIRKRLARDFERQRVSDREAVLRSFLPVVDNMERAVKVGGGGKNPWHEGMKAIHRQMVETLKANDVVAFDPKGKRFDPFFHEAAGVVSSRAIVTSGPAASEKKGPEDARPCENGTDGLVADVLLTGYTIGDGGERRVLRPAKVAVFKERR
jgi:molecular chaperone GrpE (heat shock protein)